MTLMTTYTTTFTQNGIEAVSTVATAVAVPVVTQTTSGLSSSDQIALGVGLGIGIPSFVATCFGVYWTWKQWKSRRHGAEQIGSTINTYGSTTIHHH
jgi:hypothetical protein